MASKAATDNAGSGASNLSSTIQPKHSVDAVVAKAEEFLCQGKEDMAATFYARALEMDPKNTEIMDALATVHLEVGNFMAAKDLFERSMAEKPNVGFEKYFSYSQMLCGKAAVECVLRGVQILDTKIREEKSRSNDVTFLSRSLASAYCTLVEIYMTDLCDEPDAEARCETYVKAAADVDKIGIEPLQSLARLRICQRRQKDAAVAMTEVTRRIKVYQESNGTDLTELAAFEVREKTVQLLLETNQPEPALSLVHIMLHENDEIAHIWYLGALAARTLGDFQHAAELLEGAERILQKAAPSLSDADSRRELESQLKAIRELLVDSRKKIVSSSIDGTA